MSSPKVPHSLKFQVPLAVVLHELVRIVDQILPSPISFEHMTVDQLKTTDIKPRLAAGRLKFDAGST